MVIDTLRSFDPGAEENNTKAGEFIRSLRALSQRHRTAFLLIHHIKKHDGGFFNSVNIEADSLIQWLSQACGARSLINQTDFRIGVDQTSKSNASLIIRAHVRVRGELGPFYLERTLDEDQQPTGYRRLSGCEFLKKDQQDAFEKLPATFTFKEAKGIYGAGRTKRRMTSSRNACSSASCASRQKGATRRSPRKQAEWVEYEKKVNSFYYLPLRWSSGVGRSDRSATRLYSARSGGTPMGSGVVSHCEIRAKRRTPVTPVVVAATPCSAVRERKEALCSITIHRRGWHKESE